MAIKTHVIDKKTSDKQINQSKNDFPVGVMKLSVRIPSGVSPLNGFLPTIDKSFV